MATLFFIFAIIALNGAQSENVTRVLPVTTTSGPLTTTAVSVVKYNDVCTDGGGTPKADKAGKVMRCTQFTVTGASCTNECAQKSEEYYWCMTNVNKVGTNNWWDYCSLWGYTTNNAKCTDTCARHGEDYYWCHTDRTDKSKWDKCSPQGRMKPVQYTYRGSLCISECQTWGEEYYWCKKNMDHCTGGRGGTCDSKWDYCSPDPWHTRYNAKCKKPCTKSGKDYYWCYGNDGGWDYCSPASQMGVDVKDHVEITIRGVKCSNACSRRGEKFYWCRQFGKTATWDYCSPSSKFTIHNEYCTDKCGFGTKQYGWCSTADSWDYCSPRNENTRRELKTETSNILYWIFVVPVFILCCVGLCWLFKTKFVNVSHNI